MEIFWRLVLGHLIGDFTLQTNHIAGWKRRSITGMLVHCGVHPVIYSLLLWNYMGQVWVRIGPFPFTGWVCVFIIFAAHFIEDQWRVWAVLKRNAPDNTFFYIWDQAIHYAVLFAMAPAIDGSTGKFDLLNYPPISGTIALMDAHGLSLWERLMTVSRPEPWVFVGILFVLVTHFTTVSIYFLEKDYFGKDFPGDAEKYIGMAERLAVAGACMLPGVWGFGLAGA
ncbi:MAG: hypothetical protein A2901_01500, partial [Elusimicrobia bacterium RIFCSPLOWO2_01_FULL_54_10]